MKKIYTERYLQCPYCSHYISTPDNRRIPKTVGKYRIMILNNILKFKCSRCSKEFKMVLNDDEIFKWTTMKKKEREEFKLKYYKGGKKKNDKRI